MYSVGQSTPPRDVLERARVRGVQIELEIPCSKCGYVLKGLDTRGRCPECGAAVVESVFGDRLEYAARGWVWKLWAGALTVQVAVGVMTCAMVVTVGVVAISQVVFRTPPWLMTLFQTTFYVMPGLCSAGAMAGWWLLTSPDPALVGTGGDPRVRRWLRVVLAIECACWVVLAGLGLAGVMLLVPPGIYLPAASAAGVLAPLAVLAHVFLGARFVRALEPRLRSPMVEGACWGQTMLGWASAALVVMTIAAGLAQAGVLVVLLALVTACALGGLGLAHCVMVGCVRVGAGEAVRGNSK